jgi:DNA-binding transcriptional ArsR family regulator
MRGAGIKGRVLLHLLSYIAWDTEYSAPYEITIEGIAEAVSAGKNSVSRELRELIQMGLVSARKCHIRGFRAKKNAFTLTERGIEEARALLARAMSVEVAVWKGDDFKKVPLRKTLKCKNPGPRDVLRAVERFKLGDSDLFGTAE